MAGRADKGSTRTREAPGPWGVQVATHTMVPYSARGNPRLVWYIMLVGWCFCM